MVKGLDCFQAHFEKFSDCYVIIGGAAASEWFAQEDFVFRATKDIDIVLLIEVLDDVFLNRFWEFVQLGGYETKQRSDGVRTYYRFAKPGSHEYPHMLELFSRGPDGIVLGDDQLIIPIPKEEEASSLSAILMDKDYYQIVHDFREIIDGLPLVTPPGIILLKAKAWIDLTTGQQLGKKVDSKHIKKHRNDVFRLAMLLPAEKTYSVPQNVHHDFQQFLAAFPEESSDWQGIKAAVGKNPSLPPVAELIAALKQTFVIID